MTNKIQRIHFIAIGGSAMHNLAIALHQKGAKVSGSDDDFFDPSLSRLKAHGLLPEAKGWFPEKITRDLDAIIVGMHARKDNPEVIKARELEIPLYSFPEYMYMASQDKHRIVIAGSHGKTTITAMVMHVLKHLGRDFDYIVGASIEGFDVMVKLTEEAPILIAEGDEYPASPLAPKPKFLYYKPHIALISGIAWDHVNVYASENDYVRQFDKLVDALPKGGALIYNDEDPIVTIVCGKERPDVTRYSYKAHPYKVIEGKTSLTTKEQAYPVAIFGEHNMKNINGARMICHRLGITDEDFYAAIQHFKGAANRLELVAENEHTVVYKDFAHAPSKLKATSKAMKKQYPDRDLVACIELHTFSSLNKDFIEQYKGTFSAADLPIVYFNPKTVAHKRLSSLSEQDIKTAFNQPNLVVFDDTEQLSSFLLKQHWEKKNLLMMSAGSFNNLDLEQLAQHVVNHHE
ncbi:MAG: UDP-N-acetylmuramate--L-alanine ligase [Thermonemataceae bacterium]